MAPRYLAGLILSSALITLDGTATNIALPAIGRDLSVPVSSLQWISNAPLLALAALLLPAGALADRFGRARMIRIGMAAFAGAALACAAAPSDTAIIAARFVLGAGGALVLPAALAVLRGAYHDAEDRTRIFGTWAAWTGAASAAGPLAAGALVDALSWRAVFVPSAAAGLIAVLLLGRGAPEGSTTDGRSVSFAAAASWAALVGGVAYLLMQGSTVVGGRWRLVGPLAVAAAGGAVFARNPGRGALLPRELVTARNCLPANAVTFALYFGLFGLSFVVVLYLQQVLGYPALSAALALLPVSVMLLFAERFGRLTSRAGARAVIVSGAVTAAAGTAWIGAAPHPVPLWPHVIAGTALFGLGLSLAVAPLTHAAVASVPNACAGAASALNHAVVRAAGLVAIALLGSIAAPGVVERVSPDGVRLALLICAGVVAAGGVAGGLWLRDEEAGGVEGRG